MAYVIDVATDGAHTSMSQGAAALLSQSNGDLTGSGGATIKIHTPLPSIGLDLSSLVTTASDRLVIEQVSQDTESTYKNYDLISLPTTGYTDLAKLFVGYRATAGSGYNLLKLYNNSVARDCLVKNIGGTAQGSKAIVLGSYVSNADIKAINCIIDGFKGDGIYTSSLYGEALNCTAVNCTGKGFVGASNRLIVKNCVAQNNTGGDFVGIHPDSDHNVSGDATAVGSTYHTHNKTAAEIFAGGYTPKSGGPLDGQGANLGSIFTKDYNSDNRSQWDIGAIVVPSAPRVAAGKLKRYNSTTGQWDEPAHLKAHVGGVWKGGRLKNYSVDGWK